MVDSDDADADSQNSSSDEEVEKNTNPRKKAKAPRPQKRIIAPKMSVVSSTKPLVATTGKETSFDALLAKERARGESRGCGRQERPNGEMRTTWKEDTNKNNGKRNGKPQKGDQSNGTKARRSASKNVFRKM